MRLAIVHLSDVHISTERDIVFRRLEKLSNAIQYEKAPDEGLLFVVTGDIASTGAPDEYAAATTFFSTLLTSVGLPTRNDNPTIMFIPGNHDCDFRLVGDLRPKLLDDIAANLSGVDPNGQIAESLLHVQDPFWIFNLSMTGDVYSTEDRLYFIKSYRVGKQVIEFRCFNSAWLSKIHEEPGKLGFPSSTMAASASKTDADVVVALVHHPGNWLDPSTLQTFRNAIQSTADFLLTGHEHRQGGQAITLLANDTTLIHLESGPLQPKESGESEFAILHIDLTSGLWGHTSFRWNEGNYRKLRTTSHPLSSHSERSTSLRIAEAFLARIQKPGSGFLHPRVQGELTLDDIYIYPDLRTRMFSRKLRSRQELPRWIQSSDVPELLLRCKAAVIAGPSDSGKTALSRSLYLEASLNQGRIPLLLCGRDIRSLPAEEAFSEATEAALIEQYGTHAIDCFAGSPPAKRILFIDDWDEVRLSRNNRHAFIKCAKTHFSTVILFTDDLSLLEELTDHTEGPLAGFEILDIQEFGFRLRGQLIRKWQALGVTFVEDERESTHRINDSTRVVDTVLGRNLLPSYPVNILTLLQTYDSSAGNGGTGLGSYGQVYEALVTARLLKVSMKYTDVGTRVTFLSRVAWEMFSSKRRALDDRAWNSVCKRYTEEYSNPIDPLTSRQAFVDAGILRVDNGETRFIYGYGYCYFVAKYFQENLADLGGGADREQLYQTLKELSERVYSQDNANIVVFYLFLTKERSLISHVIKNAGQVFAEIPEFDFSTHADFFKTLNGPTEALALPSGRAQDNQQEYDRKRDASGEEIEPRVNNDIDVYYDETLTFEKKLVIAVRYLGLMGQILRNFPGSLKSDTKIELAFESYGLGLRILGAIFAAARNGSEALLSDVSRIIKDKMAYTGSETELRRQAERIVAGFLRDFSFGILKRISHAIGLKELESTYESVGDLRDRNLADRFIHLSIRLDHFDQFPKTEITEINDIVVGDVYGYQTLRDLVMNHLYLFPTKYPIQQWVSDTLEVKVNSLDVRSDARKLQKN